MLCGGVILLCVGIAYNIIIMIIILTIIIMMIITIAVRGLDENYISDTSHHIRLFWQKYFKLLMTVNAVWKSTRCTSVSVLAVLAELVVFALLVMLDCWCKCIASVLAIGRARQDKTVPCIPTSPTSPPTNWTFCSPDLQSTIAYMESILWIHVDSCIMCI